MPATHGRAPCCRPLRPAPLLRLRPRPSARAACRPPAARPTRCSALPGGGQDQRKFEFKLTDLDKEIAGITLPALASLAADPIAGLVDTAYIGRLGAVEIASVGIALSVFTTITKLFNTPLLAVTTSLVATAEGSAKGAADADKAATGEASSAALLIALLVGVVQAAALLGLGGPILDLWGAPEGSELRGSALAFLQVKAAGAPVTVLLLVLQGVFRGVGDTRTPFAATVGANALNIALDPLFIFALGLRAPGAAFATVLAQLAAVGWLVAALRKRVPLSFAAQPAIARASEFLGPTGLLSLRTVAISGSFATATAMAARTDSLHAAAHQICMQLWLASSLLADALAVAAQSIMARNVAADSPEEAQFVAERTVFLGLLLGLATGTGLAASAGSLPHLFTGDAGVLAAVGVIFPWVVCTQPVTAVAFVWDGVLYGVSGFGYAARAMFVCAAPAVGCMLLSQLAPGNTGFQMGAIWSGLGLLMLMRSASIYAPYKLRRPPFDKLRAGAEPRA